MAWSVAHTRRRLRRGIRRRITPPSRRVSQALIPAPAATLSVLKSVYSDPSIVALLQMQRHDYSTLFQITRKDGKVQRFTDHDKNIVWKGQTYSPAITSTRSTLRTQTGLQDQSMNVEVLIDSSEITTEELIAGKYDQAQVRTMVIDRRPPQIAPIREDVNEVGDQTFNGETASGECEGLSRFSEVRAGRTITRTCPHHLGDAAGKPHIAGCHVDIESITYGSVPVASVTDRRTFRITSNYIPAAHADRQFAPGKVFWTSGANKGQEMEILTYTETTREVKLIIPAGADISVGDTLNLIPQCDNTQGTCNGTYDNLIDYGGFLFIRGNDEVFKTP